ncbi:unnamed protein product [Urochloa humidicola]
MAMINLGNVSGPRQLSEDDIPILWHDIRSDIPGLRQTWRTLHHRDVRISPLVINGVPITPYANATTGISSNHIIRLWDSQPPPHIPYHYVADLMVHDDDGYFAAFRRGRFTQEQLQVARAGAGGIQGLGTWFTLKGMVVPAFLNATPTHIPSDHDNARPGGELVLENILYQLAGFEMDNGAAGPVTPGVKQAAWNVMVIFCEIRRLRSVLIEVLHRMQYNMQAHALSPMLWDLIRSWSHFSKIVLKELADGTLALPNLTRRWCIEFHRLTTMGCLVGVYGELLKIKLSPLTLGGMRMNLIIGGCWPEETCPSLGLCNNHECVA